LHCEYSAEEQSPGKLHSSFQALLALFTIVANRIVNTQGSGGNIVYLNNEITRLRALLDATKLSVTPIDSSSLDLVIANRRKLKMKQLLAKHKKELNDIIVKSNQMTEQALSRQIVTHEEHVANLNILHENKLREINTVITGVTESSITDFNNQAQLEVDNKVNELLLQNRIEELEADLKKKVRSTLL
jgi:uncharacterized small protein (DUF1192 family)